MIEYKNVFTIYDDSFMALGGVDLAIKDGEFISLVGPSGAGKSTLLRLLTRELSPSDGQVWVDGINLADLSSGEVPFLRRKIEIFFQILKFFSRKNGPSPL